MKRMLLMALLTLAAPTLLFGQDASRKSTASGNAVQEVKNLMEQARQAQMKGDADTLGRLLSEDFTFTNGRGQVQSKTETLSDLKTGTVKYEELKRDDLKIRFFGDTAVATAHVTVRGQRNGQDMSGQYRGTWVFAKDQGRWQAVAAQTTPVAATGMAGSQESPTKEKTKTQTKSRTED